MTRDATIYVSNQVLWMLTRVVRKQNEKCGSESSYQEPAQTTDKLADAILCEWIANHYPKLIKLWEKRAAIDNESLNP